MIPIQTQLQVVAITIQYPMEMTICNLYSPNADWTPRCLRNLLQQLPEPFMVVGDLNVHYPLWGSSRTCPGERILGEMINDVDLVLLDRGEGTYINSGSNNLSQLDLTICSPPIAPSLKWSVKGEWNTDHLPIFIDVADEYVNNEETPMAEIWDKIRAVFCEENIAEEMEIHFEYTSSTEKYEDTFKLHKEEKERNYLDFKTDSNLPHILPPSLSLLLPFA
ncbi:hypothetical protein JTB14_023914 [Gonioctena quinquepunctata]|nr:hypothetical protein JTB14_023914 [Gonioctena quinquepunctata]